MPRYESMSLIKEGREYELGLLGEPRFKKEIPSQDYSRYVKAMEHPEKEEEKWLVDYFKKYYAGDPANPDKGFLNDLRLEVAEQLEMDMADEDLENIKVYPATDTPLDGKGIDFFFLIKPKGDEKEIMLAGDVTLQSLEGKRARKEGRKGRADVIITGEVSDPNLDEKGYEDTYQKYGRMFAIEALKKMKPEAKPLH